MLELVEECGEKLRLLQDRSIREVNSRNQPDGDEDNHSLLMVGDEGEVDESIEESSSAPPLAYYYS